MSKSKTDNKDNYLEIVTSDSEMAVYKRIIPRHGRSAKHLKKVQENSPTATLHFFDIDDFNNLKSIEAELSQSLEGKYSNKRSVVDILYSFLEIK
jgi:hypothetical protein